MKSLYLVSLSFCFSFSALVGQDKSTSPLTISGYVETYYSYDINRPKSNTLPSFLYSFNRANEVNINLAFIKAAYLEDNVRANLSLMTGTYGNANLSSESGILKNIFEANVGVKISKSKNVWVDAGIFPSHIGFESAIGKDCWNLTRSILAENTPYYESGVKAGYTTDNGKWFLSAMVLNGWQRIERIPGSTRPAFGTQLTFKPTSSLTFNSSTFIGSNSPDSTHRTRYFHNFYAIFQMTPSVSVTGGFDIGIQGNSTPAGGYAHWLSPVVIVRTTLGKKASLAGRVEYYSDPYSVIITTSVGTVFQTTGVSANFDWNLSDHAVWRIEPRLFSCRDAIFIRNDHLVKTELFLTTSLAVSF